MITVTNGNSAPDTDFATHMAALERLRRELESGDLDPVEALERCREAEEHYRAVDTILTGVERELDEMRHGDEG
jgi:exonuclease VII small subunit